MSAASDIPNGAPEKAARTAVATFWGGARLFSIVVFLATWELLAHSGWFTSFQLPALSRVIARIWSDAVSGDLAIALAEVQIAHREAATHHAKE